jgi:hypothetical protein
VISESVSDFEELLKEVGEDFFINKSIYKSKGVWNKLERFEGL